VVRGTARRAVAAAVVAIVCTPGFSAAAGGSSSAPRGFLAARAGSASAATLPSGFQEWVVFSGLTQPTAVRFASDGRGGSASATVSIQPRKK
jgi:hypothetical protein